MEIFKNIAIPVVTYEHSMKYGSKKIRQRIAAAATGRLFTTIGKFVLGRRKYQMKLTWKYLKI